MMSVWDWLIVIVPTLFVLGMGLYSRRYLRDVTTFLSSGRVCGRYVISVGDIASGLSVIGLMRYVEVHYKTGFATAFWTSLLLPVGVVLGLFGYVTYRFRETKSQSIGQFIEMRYSRKLRIFAAALRSTSEMLANMILPALAARFFIYFLDLPHKVQFLGMTFSTFHLIMLFCLFLAISIICMGGAMSIIITDTIQGCILYGAAIGRGTLTVLKDMGGQEPTNGTIPLVSGEIAEDIASYFATSEQIPTLCALGVLVDKDLSGLAAGGVRVQLLPFADPAVVDQLEKNAASLTNISKQFEKGLSNEEIAAIALDGIEYDLFDEIDVDYQCTCSRERMAAALHSVGKAELRRMLDEQLAEGKPEELTISCHFCGNSYCFTPEHLEKLF